MAQSRPARAIVACLAALVLFTALDLWTKAWAMENLSEPLASPPPLCSTETHARNQRANSRTITLVPAYLELRYAENCGAAFGLLDRSAPWLRSSVFIVAGIAAIGALLGMFIRGRGGALFAWSVPLVVSGALGNMIDRVRLGYVVDFIRFFHGSFQWPTFNVADVTISVGVALLLLDGLRRPESEPGVAVAGSGESTRPEQA